MDVNQLKKMIIDAFSVNPYPGDNNIAANPIDLELETLDDFIGMNWQNITVDFISPKHTASLCFMTPIAYAYYVPAYMLASIEAYRKSDLVPGNLISNFTLPTRQDTDRLNAFIRENTEDGEPEEFSYDNEVIWFSERVQMFSIEQKKAIYAFLRFMHEHHNGEFYNEPQVAIERFWKDFSI